MSRRKKPGKERLTKNINRWPEHDEQEPLQLQLRMWPYRPELDSEKASDNQPEERQLNQQPRPFTNGVPLAHVCDAQHRDNWRDPACRRAAGAESGLRAMLGANIVKSVQGHINPHMIFIFRKKARSIRNKQEQEKWNR